MQASSAPNPGAPSDGMPFVVGRPLRASERIFGRDDAFRAINTALASYSANLAASLGDSTALATTLRVLLRRELIRRAGDETFAVAIPLVAAYVWQETVL
jgi:hypothetical protein